MCGCTIKLYLSSKRREGSTLSISIFPPCCEKSGTVRSISVTTQLQSKFLIAIMSSLLSFFSEMESECQQHYRATDWHSIYGKESQRDKAAKFGILGLEDNTHLATTKLLQDVVNARRFLGRASRSPSCCGNLRL